MELKIGQIISVAKYNAMMESKWRSDYDKRIKQPNGHMNLPQLAMYLFFDTKGNKRQRGYVLQYKEGVMCLKTKKDCLIEKARRGI